MLVKLQNDHWQAGILPSLGGSIAFGRVRYAGVWVDIIRPANTPDYSNPGSFLMMPWANRIRDGVLRFNGQQWQLQTAPDDGTARHGDVRKREWEVINKSDTSVELSFIAANYPDLNFPFQFSASATYSLDANDFAWHVSLKNEDTQSFPAGFGFHPYFQHIADNMPLLQVACDREYQLTNAMPDAGAMPISERLDFREPRAVTSDTVLDDLVTGRAADTPNRLIYEDWNIEIQIHADEIFEHVILFTAPDGTLAVEQQTNANDGFNLHDKGIEGSGVFVLNPGDSASGTVRLRAQQI